MTEGFINRKLFLTVLEAGKSKFRVLADTMFVEHWCSLLLR